MNWDAVSAISDITAAFAVVASLWYLAAQIRQNTKAITANSRQGLLDADLALISKFIDHGVDPHLISDDDDISPENERRITWMVIKALRIREFAWHQHRAGILDRESWDSYMAPIPNMFATARARKVLDFYTGGAAFLTGIRRRISPQAVPAPATGADAR